MQRHHGFRQFTDLQWHAHIGVGAGHAHAGLELDVPVHRQIRVATRGVLPGVLARATPAAEEVGVHAHDHIGFRQVVAREYALAEALQVGAGNAAVADHIVLDVFRGRVLRFERSDGRLCARADDRAAQDHHTFASSSSEASSDGFVGIGPSGRCLRTFGNWTGQTRTIVQRQHGAVHTGVDAALGERRVAVDAETRVAFDVDGTAFAGLHQDAGEILTVVEGARVPVRHTRGDVLRFVDVGDRLDHRRFARGERGCPDAEAQELQEVATACAGPGQ